MGHILIVLNVFKSPIFRRYFDGSLKFKVVSRDRQLIKNNLAPNIDKIRRKISLVDNHNQFSFHFDVMLYVSLKITSNRRSPLSRYFTNQSHSFLWLNEKSLGGPKTN